jgi:hypothetical protein
MQAASCWEQEEREAGQASIILDTPRSVPRKNDDVNARASRTHHLISIACIGSPTKNEWSTSELASGINRSFILPPHACLLSVCLSVCLSVA